MFSKYIKIDYIFIILLIALVIPYFYVSVNSPIIFGDEGYHAFNAKYLAEHGFEFPKYVPIWDTEIAHIVSAYPPMFMLSEAVMYLFFGEFGMKLLNPLFTLVTAVFIYKFFERLNKKYAGMISSLVYLVVPNVMTYGILAYTDSMMTMFIMIFIYYLYKSYETNSTRGAAVAGVSAGLALLTKALAVSVFPIAILMFLFSKKKNFKILATVLIISGLFLSFWLLRNYLTFQQFCYDPLPCHPVLDVDIPHDQNLKFAGRVPLAEQEASVWAVGLIWFSGFSYGIEVFILFVLGLVFLIFRRKDYGFADIFIAYLLVFILMFSASSTDMFKMIWNPTGSFIYIRAEDTSRYILASVPLVVMLAGLFLSEYFEKIKTLKYGKYVVLVIIVILAYLLFDAYSVKIGGLYNLKSANFPSSWFEACDWLKMNTPKDTLIYSVYSSQIAYTCDRPSTRTPTDNADIQLSENDTTYERLRIHGFRYVYVVMNQISNVPYEEAYYTGFVNYIDNSDKFKLVYDNTPKYGYSGVRIYEIL